MKIKKNRVKKIIQEASLTKTERDKLSEIIGQLENSSKMHGEQAEYIKKLLEDSDLKEGNQFLRKRKLIKISKTNLRRVIRESVKKYYNGLA